MGIPQLFSWVVQQNPELICAPGRVNKSVQRFYLDYNALVYQVWHIIQEQEITQKRTEAEWESYLISQVVQYTTDLIAWVNPQSRVIISIDGVVPRAKIEQQRRRRFKLLWARECDNVLFSDKKEKPVFDTSKITVGTAFWGTLVEALKQSIHAGQFHTSVGHNRGILPMIVGQEPAKSLEIEIHDAQTRGEGEHKICQDLLKNPTKEQILIYGLDADLLLLTLRATVLCPNIALLRESTSQRADQEEQTTRLKHWNTPFFWIDIGTFKIIWIQRIQTLSERNTKHLQWTHESLIADAMIIYCFLGNDFIQQQPSLDIQEGGIDNLWRVYIQVRQMRQWTLIREGQIHWEFLLEYLKRLSQQEIHQCKYLQNRRRMKSRNKKITQSMTTDEQKNQWDRIWGNEYLRSCYEWTDWTHPQATEQYHQYHFGFQPNTMNPTFYRSSFGQRICRDYLRTLNFVFQYYWNEAPCWTFYYAYPNVPLFSDLYSYLSSIELPLVFPSSQNIIPSAIHQGSWVMPPQLRSHVIGLPDTYHTKSFEFPNETSLYGSDRYWLGSAETKLPPARWLYWRLWMERYASKQYLEIHPILKFKFSK